jgi:hypothetical protein
VGRRGVLVGAFVASAEQTGVAGADALEQVDDLGENDLPGG